MIRSADFPRGASFVEFLATMALTGMVGAMVVMISVQSLAPLRDRMERSKLHREAEAAVDALGDDFRGYYGAAKGTTSCGRLVGRRIEDGGRLLLCFDGASGVSGSAEWSDPDIVIAYFLRDRRLWRQEGVGGSPCAVAADVAEFALQSWQQGTEIRIVFAKDKNHLSFCIRATEPWEEL